MKELFDLLLHFKLKALFIEPSKNNLIQFFRYAFVGGIAALADWGSLFVATELGLYYLYSTVIAFLIGLIVNFVLSKLVVFNAQDAKVGRVAEFIGYAVIGVIGLGITLGLMYIFTDVLQLHYMLSKIVATAIVLIWNYCARRWILYK